MTKYSDKAAERGERAEFAFRAVWATAALVTFAAVAFAVWQTRSVFFMLFAGATFAVFLHGVSEWVGEKTTLSYRWSLSLVAAVLILLIAMTAILWGAQISGQLSQLANTLPETIRQVQENIEKDPLGRQFLRQMDGNSLPSGTQVVSEVTNLATGFLKALTAVAVIGFVGLYGAIEPGLYRAGVLHLVPAAGRERANEVLDRIDLSLRLWLIARVLSMLIIGILTTLGLWVLGVPLPLALGLLAFFLVAIPNFGPVLASVPAILIAWSHGGLHLAGQALGLYLVIETIESYVLLPLIAKETVYLPPILSVVVVIFFGMLGGVLGAFVAAPLLVVLMLLVQMLYVEDVLDDHSVKKAGDAR